MPSLVPSIAIELDKVRHLRLDNRALFEAELLLSRTWNRKVSVLQTLLQPELLGMNDLACLLYAGLQHEDASLTLPQVQDAMDLRQMPALLEALYNAWNAATQPVESQEEPSGPLAIVSPGEHSGALPASNSASAMVSFGA